LGEDTLAVLDLLLPAFQAGIDMVQRMEAGRGAMMAASPRRAIALRLLETAHRS
jgi:hypothetical protein